MLRNIFFSFILYVSVLANRDKPLVELEQGTLLGEEKVPSTEKDTYFSFKGIPYAKPPLGDLRFKEPQPAEKWKGVRKAFNHCPVCIQQSTLKSDFYIGNEDCLCLNVYTPKMPKDDDDLMPVMFFIHGGAFVTGSGNDDLYAPDFLMGHGVVLVTINYRLSLFGFISVETKEVPGNAGLKDQIAALKWVQANIDKFGGDPDNVTIFGHSAGAACVNLHMISPAAKGLFQKAIAMSGSLFNDYVISFAYRHRAFTLGDRLGYHTTDPDDLLTYLRTVSAEKLVQTKPYLQFSDEISNDFTNTIFFTPIIEKELGGNHYITEQTYSLVKKGIYNNFDLLIGHTEAEGLRDVLLFQTEILKYYYNRKELYLPLDLANKISISDVLEIGDKIEKHYFGNQTVSLDNISSFIEYYSYAHYVFGIHYFLDNVVPFVQRRPSAKRYFYLFAMQCSRNVYSEPAHNRYGIYKASHRDDLPYIFDGSGYNLIYDKDSEDAKCVDLMTRIYTNFAKTGDPSPEKSFRWPEYDKEDKKAFVIKLNEREVIQFKNSEELQFWNNIYSDAGVMPYTSDVP